MITPKDFVDRWGQSALREQQAAQSHFNELCALVGHKTPTQLDPEGTFFTFEENVAKATGGRGRADVWYKGHFAWEYKGKHKDLDAAYNQLQSYRGALDNPPLLVVCDFLEYRIYPQWTNTSGIPFVFHNEDLLEPETRRYIAWLLEDPKKFLELRQADLEQREKLTLALARKFAELADLMRGHKGEDGQPMWTPMQIARFLTKLVFALFAEDVDLMPRPFDQPAFRYLTVGAGEIPESFVRMLRELFMAMNGQLVGFIMKHVPYFDGYLFAESSPGADDGLEVLDLTQIPGGINLLAEASEADWRFVNPSIFGTLFEGALDPGKRAQLGAHYTGESDIRLVIEPVLMEPLHRLWDEIRAEAEPLMQTFLTSEAPRDQQTARDRLTALHDRMMDKLGNTRVLDPACGSGNFLYVSLRAMKDLEGRVRKFFEPLGLPFRDVVTPRQLFGIEKDEFAAKLAYVVVWIGYLQWRYEDEGVLHPVFPHRQPHPRALPNPILRDKFSDDEPDRFVNDDAIMRYEALTPNEPLTPDPSPTQAGRGEQAGVGEVGKPYEPEWPEVDVIVGNPPFLGGNKIRSELGAYVDDLFRLYEGRVPAFADLVTYWFEKARAQIEQGKAKRAGLLATNSIRGGANRVVLERIKQTGDIFLAWSDRPWVLHGAAVRISIVGFDDGSETTRTLDGNQVSSITPDLNSNIDATIATVLPENRGICFMGPSPKAPFDIPAKVAQAMLVASNVSGQSNADVVRPVVSGVDLVGRARREWTIDFGLMSLEEAKQYEVPFQYIEQKVFPIRSKNRRAAYAEKWWQYAEARPGLRQAINGKSRFIVTPTLARHRIFVWGDSGTLYNQQVITFAREDDYFFGVLHSYAHEIWSLRLGTSLEDRPRYTPTTTFETFPFPWSPGHEDTESAAYQAISAAAQALHEERDAWLNPPELISLGAGVDSKALKERTLTNLYNAVAALTPDPSPTQAGRGESGHDDVVSLRGQRAAARGEVKLARNDAASAFAPRVAALHDRLDAAVLAAYGWDDLAGRLRTAAGDEELLRRLLAENGKRSAARP